MLFNSLRLGFVVLPERVVEPFAAARSFLDRHPPTLEQAVLADFIMEGHFGHHVRRMRQVYDRRSNALCEASLGLAGQLDVMTAVSGMRTLGWVRTGQSDTEVSIRARSLGLEVAALSDFTLRHSHPSALLLGFAGCSTAELKRGVEVLRGALDSSEADTIITCHGAG
jgi:GntR family transcriptional regulator/MocR family aminotransferase